MEIQDLDTLVLESKYPYYQYLLKGPRVTVWKDGYPVQEPKHWALRFDRFLCILDDEARNYEWDDEDKLYVIRAIEQAFKDQGFTDMWVHEKKKPGKPWPTYDETDAKQIPMIAHATGTLGDALSYERQVENREPVIKKLSELLDSAEPVKVTEDDFAVA